MVDVLPQFLNNFVRPGPTATNVGAIPATNPASPDAGAKVNVYNNTFDPRFTGPNALRFADQIYNRDRQNGQPITTTTTTPADTSFDARIAGLGLNFNPVSNPLNALANYTYHIRWFLTSEEEAYNNVDIANPNSNAMAKTVIAESGVTAGFNILELKSIASCAANNTKRNMWAVQEFDLTVSEPLGLSLMDKIYAAAQEGLVANHMRCPYFLEIWFKGYDEDGNLIADNLYYNLYRVVVQNISVQATHVGSTYSIKMICDNVMGEMNQKATPMANIKIKAVTLADFFLGYQEALNKQQTELNHDGVQRTTYKIVYPDVWKTWNLKAADINNQVARNTDMQASALGNQTVISINKGQAIENIVNFVVYLSENARAWITGEDASTTGGASLSGQGILKYVTVYSSMKIVGWDFDLQDYKIEITYTLIPTESTKAYTDMQSAIAAQKQSTQLSKLRYLISNNRLVKRYDYIYTGKNTEVVTFDIKIDNYWAITQPIWNQSNAYHQFGVGPLAAQNSQGYLQVKGLLPQDQTSPAANRIAQIDKLLGGNTFNFANGVRQVDTTGNNSIDSVQRNALIAERTNLVTGNGTPSTTPGPSTSSSSNNNQLIFNHYSAGDLAAAAALNDNPAVKNFLNQKANYLTNRESTLATTFLEDYQLNDITQPPLPVVGMFDPKPYGVNAIQNADQTKTTPDRDPQAYAPGTGFVGAIFGNLFDGTAFLQIDLGIRGDPWWIPTGNIFMDYQALQYAQSQQVTAALNNSNPTADYLGGDNCILLEFKTGIVIDEDTGLAKTGPGSGDFFNGIYNIMQVENLFNRGKFTQQLKCSKDVLAQTALAGDSATINATTDTTGPSDFRAAPGPIVTGGQGYHAGA